MNECKNRFKILCIDGGGIKGLYSAEVLAMLEKTYGYPLSDYFDMICGTSTGGIIALGISAKIEMERIVSFYMKKGPLIFGKWQKRINAEWLLGLIQAVISSKYSNKQLKKALMEVFGERKIKESNNLLCVPSYNISTATNRIFKKDYEKFTLDDEKYYVDVALATSAAPTYFPIHTIDNVDYIDGGLWANDPTMVAISEYLRCFSDKYNGLDILSISSCEKNSAESPKKKNCSFFRWRKTLFDVYTNGQNQCNRFFLDQVRSHLDFDLNIVRIKNEGLSEQQSELISMDSADSLALQALSGIGKTVGANWKIKEDVEYFFRTKKKHTTYNYGK